MLTQNTLSAIANRARYFIGSRCCGWSEDQSCWSEANLWHMGAGTKQNALITNSLRYFDLVLRLFYIGQSFPI